MGDSIKPTYQRILLKLSGEAFMGGQKCGIEASSCHTLAQWIQEVWQLGVQIGLVVGGGNIFRGTQAQSLHCERTPADHIGMLATAINGLILQQALARLGISAIVMSPSPLCPLIEPYNWARSLQLLAQNVILIFVGGTGHPYFTTDSAAALRANEIRAQALLKATQVDGIFSADPLKNSAAIKYDQLTYSQILSQGLQVMDATATALCATNQMPIHVFKWEEKALLKVVCGHKLGTFVTGGP